jgi:hypothetical protein
MQKYKCWLVAVFSALVVSGLFARGSSDTVETPAKSVDSWLETVDVKDRKPGKYNIVITAKDLAGNKGLAGPFNMYIDPNSDLPVTGITNPLEDMRVPGNLNVVGTCVDDDAVEYVEILLDDSETPIRAEGRDFWSYYLDTTKLSEGKHKLSIYGVDINGVKGKAVSVTWNLDRNTPETAVNNRAMGSLVSGKFDLSGIVTDGNGIKRLFYSLDAGAKWQPLDLKYEKKDNRWTFSLTVNSLLVPDGPSVCWFKAEDGQGSIGIYTFLYFVDNTKPTVTFISPATGAAVNGVFSVSGAARDTIGIASLSWREGKNAGVFDLVKGDPYWVKEFDIRDRKEKLFTVDIIATDIAGNVTTVTQKIPVDLVADIPVLTLDKPAPDSVVESELRVSGFAVDDDSIAEIWYSVDKKEAVKIESKGAFNVALSGFATGKHALEVWPVDENLVAGARTVVPFTVSGAAPEIKIDAIAAERAELHCEAGTELSASVASTSGLKSVAYSITGRSDVTVNVKSGAASAAFKIPVSADFPYGQLALEVKAVDVYDRESKQRLNFYVTNLAIPRDEVPSYSDDTLKSSGEVAIPASGKTPASVGTATVAIDRVLPSDVAFSNGMLVALAGPGRPKAEQIDGSVRLAIDSPVPITGVSWSLNGGAAAKVAAQKSAESATAYTALIPLKALLPAEWTKLEATVTFKDLTTQAVSGVFCVVRPSPAAGIFDDEQFAWGQASRNASDYILLYDGATVSGLYNGKPDKYASSVAFKSPVAGLSVSLSGNAVTVSGAKDGEYPNVELVITDNAGGKFTTAPATFVVDSALPSLSVDTTERPTWLQAALPVSYSASDSRGVAKVEYSFDDGSSWTAFAGAPIGGPGSPTKQSIDISSLPDGKIEFLARATDLTGRVATDWRTFVKDTAIPTVAVTLPAQGDVVNGETTIAFSHSDATKIVSAEYRAPGDRTAKDPTRWLPLTLSSLTNARVGTTDQPLEDKMEFRFIDSANNATVVSAWPFTIDAKADLPVVEIHVPEDNAIIRKDFIISGVVYDDDQPAKIMYKIDDNPYTELAIENSYSIPIPLLSLTDNEHVISVYAVDIHGIRGEEVVRKIRVSLEEPKAAVQLPSFETTNKGVIDISGVASDKNGIARVEISLDNGNSFNLAEGTESWKYRFDTRVIQDGTHVVFVRVYDNYEITGLYSSLINIDNSAPSVTLELPLDGSRSSGNVFISGQTYDSIALEKMTAKISGLDSKQPAIPAALANIPFDTERIISRAVDISSLSEGFYNIEISAFDRAGNVTRVSRNFEVYRGVDRNRIDFLYPMNGEKAQGTFNIYGRVYSEEAVTGLKLFVDDAEAAAAELSSSGYFKFTITPGMIADGTHKLAVRATLAEDKTISSESHSVIYKNDGAWVSIDNLAMGDFAIERPWLSGGSGYAPTAEETAALGVKETAKDAQKAIESKSTAKVEISFDNGKSFLETESDKKGWKFRLETGELTEGYHFMIVRATMKDGAIAVSRTIVQVDKTLPLVKLISPGEGGRYNNEITFSGLSSDDVKLESVMLALRPGDKASYAVPAFIQGLYFDGHFWGATLYDVGVGLTFFEDNVKLQAQFGQFTEKQRAIFSEKPARYGGNVYGIKLLANLMYMPFEFFLGPDFSWLSATAAIGANFSYFTETQSGSPQILSALLGQIEFPRFTAAKRSVFSTFSFYTEGQLWFIPTDVDTSEVDIKSLLPHVTCGVRLNVF